MVGHAPADVIYSNLQNIPIPSTFDGVFVDVDGGLAPSPATFNGWDINPFIGGKYLANSAAFQPARDGVDGIDTILKFNTGDTISSGLNFATGRGGSLDHLGNAAGQFTPNKEGYLGFRLNDNYGWMRVVLGGATPVIKDWAYDTSGSSGSIVAGNVQQNAADQPVTLNSAYGSFTLGSQITGSNSVLKTGANSATLTGTNDYSGTTTVSEGGLLVNGSITGTGTVSVASGATLGGTGGIAGAVTINDGILSPGTSIQSLSSGALTFNGGTFEYEMNSSAVPSLAADFQRIDGRAQDTNLVLNGTVYLTLTDLASSPDAFAAGTTLTLINYAGKWNGGFFTYGTNTLENHEVFTAGRNTWQINYGATTGGMNFASEYNFSGSFVTLTAIPEPGSLLAIGCLVGSGAFLRARRRH